MENMKDEEIARMAERFIVNADGIEMEYLKFGSGDRIFAILPGLSIQSVMDAGPAIEEAYALLKDDFTVYVFDRRKNMPSDYSIYGMADDTAAAMKELGLKDVHVFGASQGGMIAMAMAIRHPELIKKIVLGSTSPHVLPEQQKVIDDWIALAEAGDAEGLYQEFGKEIYPPEVYEQYRDYFAEAAKGVTDKDLERFLVQARSIADYDVTPDLKKIGCPTLALGVFEDAVLDSDATMEIAENLDDRPDFSLYMYKGYGHAAFDTAPDYKKRIYDFLMK